MHEAPVSRTELNQYEAMAFDPTVGLSAGDAQKLHDLASSSYKVNTMPGHLKRKVDAIIQPYVPPPTAVPTIHYDEATLEAHPSWIAFVQDTQWTARVARLAALEETLNAALAKLPAAIKKFPTREAQISRGCSNDPSIMTAFLEHRRLDGIQSASRRKKMNAIKMLIAEGAAEGASGSASAHVTYEARDARKVQFAKPSVLLDIAIQYAPLDKAPASNAGAPTSGGSKTLFIPPQDGADDSEAFAFDGEDVPLDHLIDPDFVEFEEGELNVEELPAWLVRAGYIRMLALCGKDMQPTCPMCEIDATVGLEEREVEWTPWYLERHIRQFHTTAQQLVRWWKLHQACFLCAMDGTPESFKSRSTYQRHLTNHHSNDPRMAKKAVKLEVPVSLPAAFISPETAADQDTYWTGILEGAILPSTFLSDVEMKGVVDAAMAMSVDTSALTRGVNVGEVTRHYKRLKLTQETFVFVGA
ncbi:hypothetical protein B0H17DRAFT_210685 [Mycena rosella]|uniref:Uncharacterized protein n=1 Tax=Mycena rosella TaxID=1033263 RepID=A0AAD7GLK7_MYCRO|nr:hypothetical protein B0H17DRAFT_210685 [Mycena rosella]